MLLLLSSSSSSEYPIGVEKRVLVFWMFGAFLGCREFVIA